jgi:hypothetical protein
MSWSRKLEDVRAALTKALDDFFKTRLPDLTGKKVADDLMTTAVRISMDRSATRLRRRLYAQWLRPDLAAGEVVYLAPDGLKVREEALLPDPKEVGDLFVDVFRVAAVARGLGGAKGKLSPPDRVAAAMLILNTVAGRTTQANAPFSTGEVGLLLTLHAVEASKRVKKDAVSGHVARYFGQWGLPMPSQDQLAAHLERLLATGCITESEDGGNWVLQDRVGFAW